MDSAANQPPPKEVTDRGVSIAASDAAWNECPVSRAGGDAEVSGKDSFRGRDTPVLPRSAFLMSAASRLAWGGVVLVILWAAIFWAVRA